MVDVEGNLTPMLSIGKISAEDPRCDPGARLPILRTGYASVSCMHGSLLGCLAINRGTSERWKVPLLNVVE